MPTLEIGQAVPDFTAPMTGETSFTLSDYRGKSNLIIYFYPKDNTPGCTTEGQEFRDAIDAFKEANTVIYGVSRDSMKTHENFKAKHEFPFELISDPEEIFCKLFDVIKLKKLYGKEYLGIDRSTFLSDSKELRKYLKHGSSKTVASIIQG